MRKAIEHFEQALVIVRKIGDKRNEDTHLGNRGLIIDKIGQREKARKKLTEWQ